MKFAFCDKLDSYLCASYPLLWVQTHEESRAIAEIVGDFYSSAPRPSGQIRIKRQMYDWDAVRGLSKVELNNRRTPVEGCIPVKKLLDFIEATKDPRSVFIVRDFHTFLNEPVVRRAIRNMINQLKGLGTSIIFISPVCAIHEELVKDVQLLEYALPGEECIAERLDFVQAAVVATRGADKTAPPSTISPELKLKAIEAAKGLTHSEAENAFTLALVENKMFNERFVQTVFGEKIVQVKKNGLLTYLEPDVTFDQVGGLEGLKIWIRQRGLAYSPAARAYGLPYPRGVLLAGIPGCGS